MSHCLIPVNDNSLKEVLAAETDSLIRTDVLWRDLNVVGPSKLILSWHP